MAVLPAVLQVSPLTNRSIVDTYKLIRWPPEYRFLHSGVIAMTYNAARLAQFVHLFLFALVTGVFWGTWFSLSRAIASIWQAYHTSRTLASLVGFGCALAGTLWASEERRAGDALT